MGHWLDPGGPFLCTYGLSPEQTKPPCIQSAHYTVWFYPGSPESQVKDFPNPTTGNTFSGMHLILENGRGNCYLSLGADLKQCMRTP